MRRYAIRAAILAVVMVCLFAPVVELFDNWDSTLQSGNDVESSVAVVAVCLGTALVLMSLLSKFFRGSTLDENAFLPQQWHFCPIAVTRNRSSHSPPALRI